MKVWIVWREPRHDGITTIAGLAASEVVALEIIEQLSSTNNVYTYWASEETVCSTIKQFA